MGLLLALAAPAHAASLYSPGLKWRTLVTPHFRIHYHQGLEAMALRLAGVAEAVHEREVPRMGWEPDGPTHVVLADQTDIANGLTTVFPFRLVVLNATLPDGDLELALNTDSWLYLLFLHEYVHVLHGDRGEGLPLALRGVFGRMPLLFPNLYNPLWMVEGIAVYEETEGTGGGRNRGSLYNGMLRAQAAEGTLRPISVADNPIATWPGGQTPYLYGGHFLQDLTRTDGAKAPFRLIENYSDNLIPFFIRSNFRETLGEDLVVRWKSWQQHVRDGLRHTPPERYVPERLTRTAYYTLGPRLSPGGDVLAYTARTPDDHTRILLRAPDGGPDAKPRELAWRNGGRGLAFTPDGARLVFAQPEFRHSFRLFSDLYTADLKTGKVRRLTRGARLREPDVGPDGRVVAVANGVPEAADTTLVLLDAADRHARPRTLLQLGPETLFAQPRFAPDGRTVAVSVWRPGQGRQIALVNVADGSYRFVTTGPAHHVDPTFSPDGRYLLYAADPGGILNLFALDLQSGARFQVTDEVGGAVQPEVAPDGRSIVFTRLGGQGFDLYRMLFTPARWSPAPEETAEATPSPAGPDPDFPPADAAPVLRTERYHPYPAALPRFWLPVAYEQGRDSFYGVFTLGADPLAHHLYAIQAAVQFPDRVFEGVATYIYDRFYPTVQLTASQDILGRVYTVGGVFGGWARKTEGAVDLIFPFNHVNHSQRLLVGYGVEDQGIDQPCATCVVVGKFTNHYLRLGLRHDDSQRYGLGISRTDGRRIALTSEIASDAWGSDRDGSATVLDWREYTALPFRAQVLATRVTGGTATGSVGFTAGGPPNAVEDAFDRDLAVRGFPGLALAGDRVVRETLEWRFPLGLPEWAPGTVPLFLEKFHGALFAEGAQMRETGDRWKHVGGGGLEVGTDMVAGYFIPLTIRLGVAVGGGKRGETQTYVRVEGVMF